MHVDKAHGDAVRAERERQARRRAEIEKSHVIAEARDRTPPPGVLRDDLDLWMDAGIPIGSVDAK